MKCALGFALLSEQAVRAIAVKFSQPWRSFSLRPHTQTDAPLQLFYAEELFLK